MSLTEFQKKASQHGFGPALTLAIPGSGKTTLLLHRLINLVESGLAEPEQILTLTFSKASATDMSNRYRKKFSASYPYRFDFMTIHRFAYGIFKKQLKETGKNPQLLDDGPSKYKILNGIYQKYEKERLTEENFEQLTSQISLLYNLMLKSTDPQQPDFQWDSIYDMARDFHRFKKANGFFDFDDMLLEAINLLKQNPSWLNQLRSQYRFIQVDEAQDTSKLQYALIELLLCEQKNLFLVADDDQSIYGFRGAHPSYLLDFKKHYKDGQVFYLPDNFRSDGNIVKVASGLIANNKHRFKKEMSAFKEARSHLPVMTFADLVARNHYMVEEIKASHTSTAILYRNKISSLSVIDHLMRENISFKIKDTPKNELNHFILQDLIHFFTLAMVPQDLEAFKKIAFKTNGYISKEMKSYVESNHRGRDTLAVLVEIPFLKDFQTRTMETLREKFEHLRYLRPYDAIHYIECELGYLDYIKRHAERLNTTTHYARTRLDAYKTIARPLLTGFDFIERIHELKKQILDYPESESQVTLSTLHGSKGLEFNQVFMIDVNPQTFPMPNQAPALIEEERRLFYVGMTRAEERFELLHCEFINGSHNPLSSFTEEMLSQPFSHQVFNTSARKASAQ